jgi:hypothetical protein
MIRGKDVALVGPLIIRLACRDVTDSTNSSPYTDAHLASVRSELARRHALVNGLAYRVAMLEELVDEARQAQAEAEQDLQDYEVLHYGEIDPEPF